MTLAFYFLYFLHICNFGGGGFLFVSLFVRSLLLLLLFCFVGLLLFGVCLFFNF